METRSGRVSQNFMQVGKPPQGKSHQINTDNTGCVKRQFIISQLGPPKRLEQCRCPIFDEFVMSLSSLLLSSGHTTTCLSRTPSRLIEYQRRRLCISASKTLKYRPKASSTSEYKMESSQAGWMETTCSSAMLPKLHKFGWRWRNQKFIVTPVTGIHSSIYFMCSPLYHSAIVV